MLNQIISGYFIRSRKHISRRQNIPGKMPIGSMTKDNLGGESDASRPQQEPGAGPSLKPEFVRFFLSERATPHPVLSPISVPHQ